MKLHLKLGDTTYDLKDIEKFLSRLFRGKDLDRVEIVPEEQVLRISAFDSLGNLIKKPLCPPNIKEGTVLSYYFEDKNLCLKPLRDNRFILRKGCSHKKTVRPLFSLENKFIKNAFNRRELFLNEREFNTYVKELNYD